MRPLARKNYGETEFKNIEGIEQDLAEIFRLFLIEVIDDKKLPDFLEFVRRETGSVKSTKLGEITEQGFEAFIRRLKIYYDNDEQIKIQVPGKDAKPYLYSNFGFRNNTTEQWETFIKILQDFPHNFYIASEKKRKRIGVINKKLINFFRTNPDFLIEIPENYKIYEECTMEVSKRHRFKFQVISELKGTLEANKRQFGDTNKIPNR